MNMKKVSIQVTEYDIGDIYPIGYGNVSPIPTGIELKGYIKVYDENLNIIYTVDICTGKILDKEYNKYISNSCGSING